MGGPETPPLVEELLTTDWCWGGKKAHFSLGMQPLVSFPCPSGWRYTHMHMGSSNWLQYVLDLCDRIHKIMPCNRSHVRGLLREGEGIQRRIRHKRHTAKCQKDHWWPGILTPSPFSKSPFHCRCLYFFVFCFCLFVCFETGFLCVALAVLELTL